MKRALPLWTAAVVPATLAGHALAYLAIGQSAADGQHAWLPAMLELSTAALAALLTALLAGALTRAHFLSRTRIEGSFAELAPRLACAQLVLFTAMEAGEGRHATAIGCLVQIAVACCAAGLFAWFASAFARCIRSACDAGRYLARLQPRARFARRAPAVRVIFTALYARSPRFARPPPFAVAASL